MPETIPNAPSAPDAGTASDSSPAEAPLFADEVPSDSEISNTSDDTASEESQPRRPRAEVISEIIACSESLELAPKWHFLSCAPLHRLRIPPVDLEQNLLDEFGEDALVDAGVVVRDGDDNRVCETLSIENATFRVSLDAENIPRIHARGDTLFPVPELNFFECAAERNESEHAHTPTDLILCGSAIDAEIFGLLGFRAVELPNPIRITGQHVERFFAGDVRSDGAWRYRLVLAAWSIGTLSSQPSATLQQLIQQLADAQKMYTIDPRRRFTVWRISPAELDLLTCATEFEDRAQVHKVLQHSLKAIAANEWSITAQRSKPTLVEARRRLVAELKQADGVLNNSELSQARDAFLEAGSRSIVQPIERGLEQTDDPHKRLEVLDMVNDAQHQLETDWLVVSANFVLEHELPPRSGPPPLDYINERLRTRRELRRLRNDRRK